MDAQGAVDSLVGRLTNILIDEAQLLRGVRGDVVFIKDEMESMNSLLAHLTESQHHNQQVRTWMKHVVGLTRDCEGNVELYARYISGADPHSTSRGIHGRFRRVVQFVLTIRARHRVATRIRELKIRARDVGDRRMRYGVTVPPSAALGSGTMFVDVPNPREAANNREEVQRRAQLDGEPPDDDEKTIKKGTDQVIQWLFEEAPGKLLRVIPILCKDSSESKSALAQMAARMGKGVYEHSFAEKFSCKAMISVKDFNPGNGMGHFLRDLLQKLAPSWSWTKTPLDPMRPWDETSQLTKKLQGHLKGNRFLIVLEQVRDKKTWAAIKSALFHTETDCYPGSAIIMTTVDDEIAESSSPYRILKSPSLRGFMYVRASALILETPYCRMSNVRPILELCYPDAFAMKMVLHLLYANRDRTDYELKNICKVLSECKRLNKSIAKQMLMFCYTELPSKYRSCLLYLSIFSEDCTIRTTNLSRRWAIEGLITANRDHIGSATGGIRQQASPTDQADGYLDMLITRGFLIPGEISVAGNIKSCTMHHKVREFITKIATDVNFLDTDLPSDLAHHLSIHNRIGLQESHSNHHVKAGSHRIVAFLPYLAKSSQWKLLKLLDLEGCKGLTEKHMNSICKVLLLKYLSLRNTDVAELPKQINRLRCLETLDIRQTAVRAFATRSILLPMLKHLLAGQTDSLSNHSDRFVTLRLPSGIRKMEKLEILSHVEVSGNANDLIGVRQLLQLRKLGVILNCHKGMVLLFKQIKTLHACLRSLSIRINKLYKSEDTSCFPKEESKGTPDALLVALYSPPKLLQSLNISGIIGGLHLWIEGHKHLTKITLTETYLGEDALCIFGKLIILRCLRLRHNSYTGKELSFKKEEFKSLESLAIEGSNITNITFDTGSAPKLEMIVWSFASMEAISGVNHLTKLKKLELNGDSCIIGPVRVAIKEHPNHPGLKYNGQDQLQEAATKVAASTS